jgi:predicted nucleic acid-binding protein
MRAVLDDFADDEQNGVWRWLSVTPELLERARTAVLDVPTAVFLRAGDALHLACAEEHGFHEIHTNDGHMLKAARYFHLTGVKVLGEDG